MGYDEEEEVEEVEVSEDMKNVSLCEDMRIVQKMWGGSFEEERRQVNQEMYLAKGLGIDGGSGGGGRGTRDANQESGGGDGGDDNRKNVEGHYKKMVDEHPGNPLFLGNYANFLYEAVIKQLPKQLVGGTGYEMLDVMVIDEVEMQRHHHLEKLYRSTRAGKDFQKEIVKAAEALTAIGYKHIEAGTKLSEDCSKYGAENVHDKILAKGASIYGDARKHVEKEQDDLNKLLSSEVLDPLRAMILSAPLEDARHLVQRYSRMRQEAETQAVELSRRQAKVRELPNLENVKAACNRSKDERNKSKYGSSEY